MKLAFIPAPKDPGFVPGGIRERAMAMVEARNLGRVPPGEWQKQKGQEQCVKRLKRQD
jgi:hypothetical protein